jgi:hypothetical protein
MSRWGRSNSDSDVNYLRVVKKVDCKLCAISFETANFLGMKIMGAEVF